MTPQEELYTLIPLTQGQSAKVSPHRFERVNKFKWYAHWSPMTQSFYAVRHSPRVCGNRKTIYMNRFILSMDDEDKRKVDHENLDTLDNTDENLRIASHADNIHNSGKRRNNTSGYKGVTRNGSGWQATIMVDQKRVSLGTRSTKEEAAELYKQAAIRLHGDFARY